MLTHLARRRSLALPDLPQVCPEFLDLWSVIRRAAATREADRVLRLVDLVGLVVDPCPYGDELVRRAMFLVGHDWCPLTAP